VPSCRTQRNNHVKFTKKIVSWKSMRNLVNFNKILWKFTKFRMDFQLTIFFCEFFLWVRIYWTICCQTVSSKSFLVIKAVDCYVALYVVMLIPVKKKEKKNYLFVWQWAMNFITWCHFMYVNNIERYRVECDYTYLWWWNIVFNN
jgi:hypothetical protein